MSATRSPLGRLVLSVAALGLPAALDGRAGAQDYSPRNYVAQETTATITIDGLLDEAAWGTTDLIEDFYIYQSGGELGPPVRTARLLWDDTFLYVAMEVLDQDIASANLGHDGALYEGDNVELFLAPNRGVSPYYEFEVSPNNDTFDALFPNDPDPLAYESGMISASVVDGTDGDDSDIDTGYTVEFAVPRAAMASFAAGDVWTFLASGYDYHPTGDPTLYLSSPGPTPSGFHTLAIYDNLTFRAIPEPSSVALLGAGLLGLLVVGRRRLASGRRGRIT